MSTVSKKVYLLTFGGLVALTLLTTGLGFLDMGPFNTIIAILLAATKASLIVMFFMHALYETRIVRVILAGGIIWVAILLSLTIADYSTRRFMPYPANQPPVAGP